MSDVSVLRLCLRQKCDAVLRLCLRQKCDIGKGTAWVVRAHSCFRFNEVGVRMSRWPLMLSRSLGDGSSDSDLSACQRCTSALQECGGGCRAGRVRRACLRCCGGCVRKSSSHKAGRFAVRPNDEAASISRLRLAGHGPPT